MIHQLWPEKQVYIDGRLDVFPPEFLKGYGVMMATGEGWDEAVSRHDIQLALVNYPDPAARGQGLQRRLREDPDWVCVFFSDNALVYARRSPQNTNLIRRYGTAFDPGLRSRESLVEFAATASPAVVDQTLAALQRISDLAPGEQAPGLIIQGLRELKSGQVDGTGQVGTLLARADQELAAGQTAAALETLEQAAELDPENALVQLRLGVLHARAGRLDEAEAHLSRAVELRPEDGAARQNLERVRRMRQP